MPCAGRNENRVAGNDEAGFVIDLHRTRAGENKINLLAFPVVVTFRCGPRSEAGFGETLSVDRSVRPVKDAADGGPVCGGKRDLFAQLLDDHVSLGSLEWGFESVKMNRDNCNPLVHFKKPCKHRSRE